MMGIIELEGMHFYAYHGHYEEERIAGTRFSVDVWLETDCATAAVSDDLDDAVNYQAVYDCVKEEMQRSSHLLEHVARRILDALFMKFSPIQKAKVRVSKLNPSMGGEIDKVSVTLSR